MMTGPSSGASLSKLSVLATSPQLLSQQREAVAHFQLRFVCVEQVVALCSSNGGWWQKMRNGCFWILLQQLTDCRSEAGSSSHKQSDPTTQPHFYTRTNLLSKQHQLIHSSAPSLLPLRVHKAVPNLHVAQDWPPFLAFTDSLHRNIYPRA